MNDTEVTYIRDCVELTNIANSRASVGFDYLYDGESGNHYQGVYDPNYIVVIRASEAGKDSLGKLCLSIEPRFFGYFLEYDDLILRSLTCIIYKIFMRDLYSSKEFLKRWPEERFESLRTWICSLFKVTIFEKDGINEDPYVPSVPGVIADFYDTDIPYTSYVDYQTQSEDWFVGVELLMISKFDSYRERKVELI